MILSLILTLWGQKTINTVSTLSSYSEAIWKVNSDLHLYVPLMEFTITIRTEFTLLNYISFAFTQYTITVSHHMCLIFSYFRKIFSLNLRSFEKYILHNQPIMSKLVRILELDYKASKVECFYVPYYWSTCYWSFLLLFVEKQWKSLM